MIQTINAYKLYNASLKSKTEKYLCLVEVKVASKWRVVGYYNVNPIEYTIKKSRDKIYLMDSRYRRYLLTTACINVLSLGYLMDKTPYKMEV